jgi:hypothetical protein
MKIIKTIASAMKEIGQWFGVHYSTLNLAVKKAENT